jgi:hypothetical protein
MTHLSITTIMLFACLAAAAPVVANLPPTPKGAWSSVAAK